jgi:serine/threonine-protein kinase
VLLEWPGGLPGPEWPALTATAGVWYRLLSQAALGLQAAHAAGLCHGHLGPAALVLTAGGVVKLTGLGEPRWLAGLPDGPEGPAADLTDLGRLAAGWAAPAAPAKAGKVKPLPDELQAVLARLQSAGPGAGYAGAAELLDDLGRAGAKLPSGGAAWERLLRQVREQAGPSGLRRSA